YEAIVTLRCFHERTRLTIKPIKGLEETPINQEDLIGMLLTFSITVFEVLEMFDVQWTAQEQRSYFDFWNIVGEILGIGTAAVAQKLEQGTSSPPFAEEGVPDKAGQEADLKQAKTDGQKQGIVEAKSLRPTTIAEGRALLEVIRG